MPVYAVGTCTARGLRALLAELGARPGGPAHVVVSDLREELVLYVNGRPYLRRELEMPSAALHHAGESSASMHPNPLKSCSVALIEEEHCLYAALTGLT